MPENDPVRMKLPCADEAQFHAEFASKLASRVFVPMKEPRAVGERFLLQIRFLDGVVKVKGTAEVVRLVSVPKDGVLARFVSLDADSLQFPLGADAALSTPGFPLSSSTGEVPLHEASAAAPPAPTQPYGASAGLPEGPTAVAAPHFPDAAPPAPVGIGSAPPHGARAAPRGNLSMIVAGALVGLTLAAILVATVALLR